MHFETLAIHAGQEPDPTTGAIIVPVFQTSTYVQDGVARHKGYEYARTQNPTRGALESALAALEGAEQGFCFASGMAAISTCMNLLAAGDHVVASDDLYGGTYRVFEKVFRGYGIDFTYVDAADTKAVQDAIRPQTRMLWIETPTNPLLKVADLGALGRLAAERKIIFAVDNTFLSPFFQRPIAFGADLVVHSTTKFLGGHSDVVGGAVVTSRDDLAERIGFCQNAVGAVPGPWDAWLVLRGLKTLAVRMERHQRNALKVARFLEGHARVERVLYPGLESHPQHELACRQTSGHGALISFFVAGGEEQARRVAEATQLFALAESLGGVESLLDHPASMTHAAVPRAERLASGFTDGLLRLSVGIEDLDDLVADLDRALDTTYAM
jgi:cystathionine gamma-lyase